jgi:hypothetical protein
MPTRTELASVRGRHAGRPVNAAGRRVIAAGRPVNVAGRTLSSVEEAELRYADCPSTSAETVIAAAPAVVWSLICDIQLPARYSSEFQGGAWLGDTTHAALGAQFRGHNHHPARGDWETVSTIYDFEPERVLGWCVGDPECPAARWRFTLEPDGAGTRLTQWMQIGPGESGVSELIAQMPDKESRILRRRLAEHQANMTATVEGIRELAEAARALSAGG